jgi:hypothetical protein
MVHHNSTVKNDSLEYKSPPLFIMKKTILAHHLLVEENELGEKASVHEAPHLAAIPPSPPSYPPSCPDLPVSSSKPLPKRAAVIVKNVKASVNIAHLPKWKKLIKRVRATLGKPENDEDRTKQDVHGKTTDRSFRTLLKTMRENFPDTISTPTKIWGTKKKDRQEETGNLSPWSRDQEDRKMDTCQTEPQKPATGMNLFTQQELALLDSDTDDETMETGLRISGRQLAKAMGLLSITIFPFSYVSNQLYKIF